MSEFLRGAVTTCLVLAGLFFLRFWKQSRDRLFLLFSLAFWLLAVNQVLLTIGGKAGEHLYLLRLSSFLLIAAAVLDKNYRARR